MSEPGVISGHWWMCLEKTWKKKEAGGKISEDWGMSDWYEIRASRQITTQTQTERRLREVEEDNKR